MTILGLKTSHETNFAWSWSFFNSILLKRLLSWPGGQIARGLNTIKDIKALRNIKYYT